MIQNSINDEKHENYISEKDEVGFQIFNMIKELVKSICQVYPTIIINQIDYTNRYIPKHWLKGSKKFSDIHAEGY